MPKPINKTIGKCKCRMRGCDSLADIRRQKDHESGARYLVCPVHGVDRAIGKHKAALESWIDENEALQVKTVTPEPAPKPTTEPEQGQEQPAPEKEVKILTSKTEGDPKPETAPPPKPAPAKNGLGFLNDL